MGLKSSQVTATSGLKPPLMARAELAFSALTSRPSRDNQASCLPAGTGRVGSVKQLERRREECEGIGENGTRETIDGAESKPRSWCASPMA